MDEGALVLFSGGQDSTTCLAWALARYDRVETVGFAYGQRHRAELDCRPAIRAGLLAIGGWRGALGPDHLVDMTGAMTAVGETALTGPVEIAQGGTTTSGSGLPNTFVPGRNLLFFTYAAAIAYRRGLKRLVGGMCETDYSGYPDCRDDTLKAMQLALNLGMERRFAVDSPLMWIDKADTWRLAEKLGGERLVSLIVAETMTCYRGERSIRHDWGFGCGICPACRLREAGWQRYKAHR